MGLERVYIVPGDSDKDKLILSELGKLTGRFISNTVKSGWVVSVTGVQLWPKFLVKCHYLMKK